jgi:uroporphyrin-III C-methyltransferase
MTKLKCVWLILVPCFLLFGGKSPGMAAPPAPGKFYVIGTGPAGPEHATLKALETMKKADLVLCHPEMAKKFQAYLKGKKVQDPWKELWFYQGKVWMKVLHLFKPEKRRAIVAEKMRQRDEYVKQLKVILAQGKKVALLDGGDPTVYSRAFWLLEGLDEDQVEIIPGVGAMTAALAALKKSSTGAGARFVAQTAPFAFFGKSDRDDLARDLSRHPGTLVFYMGLTEIDNLVNALKKYNPGDLPVAVVYYAGYPQKEKVVKGTLDNILARIAPEKEKWMGMIIVGRCLEGPAFSLSEEIKGSPPSPRGVRRLPKAGKP